MPQFTYFVEGVRDWRKVLGYAFDESPAKAPGVRGPDDLTGQLLSRDPEAVRYEEGQQWAKIAEGVYVGMDPAHPPAPADLARSSRLPGETVRLIDGDWLAPRLRIFIAAAGFAVALPKRMRRHEGEWVAGEVLPEHAEADQLATDLLRRLTSEVSEGGGDGTLNLTYAAGADYAARLLQINYHVGPEELGLLGSLPQDERLLQVMHVAVDWAAVEEEAKNLEARGA